MCTSFQQQSEVTPLSRNIIRCSTKNVMSEVRGRFARRCSAAFCPHCPGWTFGLVNIGTYHPPFLPSDTHTHTHPHLSEWVKRCRKWDAGLSLCNLPFPHLDVLTYFDWTFILHSNDAAVSLCHIHKLTHTHTHSQFPLTPSWEHFTLYIGRRYWKWRNTSSFKDAVCRHISFPLGLWVCFIFCKISRIKKALICRVLSGWGASLYAVYALCTQLGKANK